VRALLVGARHRESEVAQQTIVQCVNPRVNDQLLASRPRVLNDRGLADVCGLIDDIQLAQSVDLRIDIAGVLDIGCVLGANVLHVPQPVLYQPEPRIVERGANAAAPLMATHDDVADAQHVDGVLQDRQAIQIGVHDHVGDVAMHEKLAGSKPDNLIGRHAAVRTTNP
jgi:hypothetical protein